MQSSNNGLSPNTDQAVAFSCQRCGHCCQGKGGIVLRESDVHGCVRMRNDDVIELFGRVDEGTPVLISEPLP